MYYHNYVMPIIPHYYMKEKKCNTCLKTLNISYFEKNNKIIGKCTECREKYKQNYQSLKESGLCFSCKEPVDTGAHCNKCKIKHKLKARSSRSIALKNGLCVCCYKRVQTKNNTSCKVCLDSHNKKNRNIASLLLTQARSRSKKKNIEFSITIDDIVIPEICPILQIPLTRNEVHCKDSSYSLDRIDPLKGYVKGNVQIISHRANQIKSNATLDELEKIVSFLKTILST